MMEDYSVVERKQAADFIRQELASFFGAPNTNATRKQVVDVLLKISVPSDDTGS